MSSACSLLADITWCRTASTSGAQQFAGCANPSGQRRAVQIDAFAGIDLRLPVERKMIVIGWFIRTFGDTAQVGVVGV